MIFPHKNYKCTKCGAVTKRGTKISINAGKIPDGSKTAGEVLCPKCNAKMIEVK